MLWAARERRADTIQTVELPELFSQDWHSSREIANWKPKDDTGRGFRCVSSRKQESAMGLRSVMLLNTHAED